MTREKKEQISNRLVMNFGILLLAALVLLYVRSALSAYPKVTYTALLTVGLLCLAGSIAMFVLGKKNNDRLLNNSAIPFGVFVGCMVLYAAKFSVFAGYGWKDAVLTLYILMAVYFVIMAVITAVLLNKPTIKSIDQKELLRKKNIKKKKKNK